MIKYFIGALLGGVYGYFIKYKLIGCSTGGCPMTSNPYITTFYGIMIGVIIVGIFTTPKNKSSEPENQSKASFKHISQKQAKERMDSGDKIIILDVRTKEEYDEKHIPNAVLVPNEDILSEKPELLPDLDAEILVYCRSGVRSAQAAQKLANMGYTNIYEFGGILDWEYETE